MRTKRNARKPAIVARRRRIPATMSRDSQSESCLAEPSCERGEGKPDRVNDQDADAGGETSRNSERCRLLLTLELRQLKVQQHERLRALLDRLGSCHHAEHGESITPVRHKARSSLSYVSAGFAIPRGELLAMSDSLCDRFGGGTRVRRRRQANGNTRATVIMVASVLTVGIALTASCGGGNGGLPPSVESVGTGEIPELPPAPEPPAEPPAQEPPAAEPPAQEPPSAEPPVEEPPAAEPPAQEPPAQETQAAQEPPPGPEMSIEPPVLRLTERGDIRVRLACPSKATLCTGTVSLRARGRLLGRSLFAIEGGNTRSARVQLTERGGALLLEEHVDLATVIVVARDTQEGVQGPPRTTRTIVTLLGS